jgi:hypothetical protein
MGVASVEEAQDITTTTPEEKAKIVSQAKNAYK